MTMRSLDILNKYLLTSIPRDAASDAAAAAAAAAATPWYTGIAGADQELVGHIQTHGWDKKTPAEAAVEAAKSHREAQRHLGVPADQIIRMPKPEDAAGWKTVWQRLGAPGDPKEYDLSTVKNVDGSDIDPGRAEALRATAFRLNIPKAAVTELAKDLLKFDADRAVTGKAETDAKIAADRLALDKAWGVNKAANLALASKAAEALGVPPEAINALNAMDKVGYAGVMDMFLKIGQKIGEDKFVEGGPRTGTLTVAQAAARKSDLMADDSFQKRFLAADTSAVREMQALDMIISGITAADLAAA